MKVFVLIFLLLSNLYPIENRQTLMDSISHHAIKIGHGPNKTYSFLDPLCSKSQAFIQLISSRKDLQKHTTYYIFLHGLKSFYSEEHIIYIYQAKDSLSALKDIMIYQDYDVDINETTQQTVLLMKDIDKVVQQMKIKRRPYLLIFEKGSSYCKVSEGTAPCLEENDFD